MLYKFLNYLNSIKSFPYYFVTPSPYGIGTCAKHILLSICFKSKKENTALITVSKYNYPVEWAQTIDKKGFLKPINKKSLKIRSQDLKSTLCDAGMINIYKPDIFFKNNKSINYIPFVVPYLKTVDIDDLEDFRMAEKLFKIND